MSEHTLHLLIVDDEESIRIPLADHLRKNYHYDVDTARDGQEALQLIDKFRGHYDVALIDQVLEGSISGLELLKEIKTRYSEIQVIVFTGWGMKQEEGIEILNQGAYRYLAKPFNLEELALTIRFAADQRQVRREHGYLSTLVQVSTEIAQTTSLEKQLALVWDYVKEQLDAPTFLIALYHASTDTLQFHQSFDEGEPDPLPDRHLGEDKTNWGLTGYVVKTGQEQLWLNREEALQVCSTLGITPHLSGKGLSETGICIALRVGDEILGALSVQSYRPRAFDQAFLNAVRTLGGQLASAIRNSRLFSELKKSRSHLDGLVEGSLDAAVFIDVNRHITVFNRRAEEMLGYTADEIRGHTVTKLYSDITQARMIWNLIDQQAKIVSYAVTLKHKDGTEIPTLLSAVSVKDSEGTIIGQAGFVRDLRQLHLLEGRLRALIKAGQAIGSLLEIDKILQLIMDSSMSAFPTAEKGSIHLFSEKTEKLHIKASHGYSAKVGKALTLGVGEGFAGWVYEHGEPIVSGNVWDDKRFKEFKYPETRRQKSMICVPLRVKGMVIGTLSLDNTKLYDAFNHNDLDLLSTFAHQAGIAIENARLITREQEAQRRTKKQAGRLRVLYEIGKEITSAREVDLIWDSIAKHLIRLVGARRSLFLLVDSKGKRLIKATGQGYPLEHLQRMTINEVEAGISGWVLRTKEAVLVENVQSDPRNTGQALENAKDFETAPLIVAPLLIKDEAIGTLTVANSVGDPPFDEDDKELVVMLAAQAAIAYNNARRMHELEQLQKAAEALAGVLEPAEVLQQIVESACEILQADSSAVWSFDHVRNRTVPEELVAYRIPKAQLEKFRKHAPTHGGTAETVMKEKWVGVADISDPQYSFMGPSTMALLNGIGAKSFQGAALKVGDERLGVLYINYNHSRSFTEEDQRTLETFAYHAALALKKTRLLEQVGKARDAAKVFAQASILEDLRTTLNSIVRGTQEVLDCDAVTLYTYDLERDEFGFPPATVGVQDEQEVFKLGRVAKQSVVRNILALEKPHEAEDAASDPLMKGRFVSQEKIKSSVGIPLHVGNHKVGVMFVNYLSSHHFTRDESTNIELFANQAAVAIRNAMLLADISHRNTQLQTITEVSKSISTLLDLEKLMDRAVNVIQDRFGLYYVGLFLVDEVGKYAVLRAGSGEAGQIMLKDGHKLAIDDHSMIGWSIANAQARITSNVTEETIHSYNPHLPETRSEIALPLTSHNQCIGALTVQSNKEAAFSEDDIVVLQTMVDELAIAIQNARSYEDLKHTKGLVGARTALAWMGMVNSTWRHAIEKHAITIRDEIELCRRDLVKISTADPFSERFDKIKRLASQIKEKPITPPLGSEEGVRSVEVNELIQERVKRLWEDESYKSVLYDLNLHLADGMTVRASPEWLQRALDILIDNAVEATEGQPQRKISITTQRVDERVQICVKDNGKGISPDRLSGLFREPIKKAQGEKGLGMGLLFAQLISQTYGGDASVGSPGPGDTTLIIALPPES